MPTIKKLTNKYTELYKEYQEFLKRNKLRENDVLGVLFIYSLKYYNKNCLLCKPELTVEECSMYDLTVDDDCNWIITDNDYGTIYVKLADKTIAFRCGEECLKPKNYRFLNQWTADKNNTPESHYKFLQSEYFL